MMQDNWMYLRIYRHRLGRQLTGPSAESPDPSIDILMVSRWAELWYPHEQIWTTMGSRSQKILVASEPNGTVAEEFDLAEGIPPENGIYGMLEITPCGGRFFSRCNNGSLHVGQSGDATPVPQGIALLSPGDSMYIGFRFPGSTTSREDPLNYTHSLELLTQAQISRT